jgi:hypothetical protein
VLDGEMELSATSSPKMKVTPQQSVLEPVAAATGVLQSWANSSTGSLNARRRSEPSSHTRLTGTRHGEDGGGPSLLTNAPSVSSGRSGAFSSDGWVDCRIEPATASFHESFVDFEHRRTTIGYEQPTVNGIQR